MRALLNHVIDSQQIVEPQADALKASGMFATDVEVAPDADPQTRLLALLGRRD